MLQSPGNCVHHYVQLEKDIFICKDCDDRSNFGRTGRVKVIISDARIARIKAEKADRKFLYTATIGQLNTDHLLFTSNKQYNMFGQPSHNWDDLKNMSRTS